MNLKKIVSVWGICMALFVGSSSAWASASSDGRELGDDTAIVLDLLLFRPIGLITTIGGTVAYVVSLPISLPTQSAGKTFNSLVVAPARYTFVRSLGDESVPW